MSEAGSLASALSDVLSATASRLHPNDLAAAIVAALDRPLDIRAASIGLFQAPNIVIYGLHGLSDAEAGDFNSFPLHSNPTAYRSFLEDDVILEHFVGGGGPGDYKDIAPATSRFYLIAARVGVGWWVCAPIKNAGRYVGSLSLTSGDRPAWSPQEVALLRATGTAVGMWLTHPDSGLPTTDATSPIHLTHRQRHLLALMEQGLTVKQMAETLDVSPSTIKADSHQILRAFGASSRDAALRRAGDLGLLEGGHGR